MMKNMLLFFVMLGSILLSADDKSLVAKWSFEGDVKDSSGNGNDGIVLGKENYIQGVLGKAFDFAGDSCIKIPESSLLSQMDALTISLFVRFHNVSAGAFLIDKAYPGQSYLIRMREYLGLPVFSFQRSLSHAPVKGEPVVSVVGRTPVQIEKWYHLAIVNDGSSLRLYLDGKPDSDTVKVKGPIRPSTALLYIGGRSDGRAFSGTMDEVMIFRRALSAEEIKNLGNVNQIIHR